MKAIKIHDYNLICIWKQEIGYILLFIAIFDTPCESCKSKDIIPADKNVTWGHRLIRFLQYV